MYTSYDILRQDIQDVIEDLDAVKGRVKALEEAGSGCSVCNHLLEDCGVVNASGWVRMYSDRPSGVLQKLFFCYNCGKQLHDKD